MQLTMYHSKFSFTLLEKICTITNIAPSFVVSKTAESSEKDILV